MPDELKIDGLTIPLGEIEMRTSRSSGPGGQHANVTASRVEAVFDVEASTSLDEPQRTRLFERAGRTVVAVAQDARSQARNRELALERLAEKLGAALATPRRRRPTRPTQSLPPASSRAEAPRRRAQSARGAGRLGTRGRGRERAG